MAFSTYAPYPELGDNDAMSDVFSLNLATGALRWVNTDESGNRVGVSGFSGSGPAFGVQDFLANNGKVAFFIANSTNVGAAGIYVKDLATGALTRVFGTQASVAGFRAKVSFSDDLRKAAYVDQTPGSSRTSVQSPAVVDLATGAILNAATLTNGTVGNGRTTVAVMLSRDGKAAVFDNNSTILLGGPPPGGAARSNASIASCCPEPGPGALGREASRRRTPAARGGCRSVAQADHGASSPPRAADRRRSLGTWPAGGIPETRALEKRPAGQRWCREGLKQRRQAAPLQGMGQAIQSEACSSVFSPQSDRQPVQWVVLSTELVVRGSTRAPGGPRKRPEGARAQRSR